MKNLGNKQRGRILVSERRRIFIMEIFFSSTRISKFFKLIGEDTVKKSWTNEKCGDYIKIEKEHFQVQ